MCLYVILNRCQLFSVGLEQRLYKILLHVGREICKLEEAHNWFPLDDQLSAVYQKLEHLDDVLQCTCFWSQSVLSQNMLLCDPILDICICSNRFFENEGVPNNTSESVFRFIVRNSCIKGRKIERLYVCYLVEIQRLEMF